MHNMYGSSSIISIRSNYRASLSPSCSNEYPSSCYNNLRCQSLCCYCDCNCCHSLPVHTNTTSGLALSVNPSLLFGSRQSTLIQWVPSRRFVLARTGDRYRSSIYDVGLGYYGKSLWSVDEPKCSRISGNKGNGQGRRYSYCEEPLSSDEEKCSRRVSSREKGRGRSRYNFKAIETRCKIPDDVESMLSLLTESVSEECLNLKKRKGSKSKKGKVSVTENDGNEKSRERKENDVSRQKETNATFRQKTSDSKNRLKVAEIGHKEESYDVERKVEKTDLSLRDDWRLRRGGSTSSYYSLSDSGDIEADTEVEAAKDAGFVGESSKRHGKSYRTSGGIIVSGKSKQDARTSGGRTNTRVTKGESKRYNDEREQYWEGSRRDEMEGASTAEWDWRKKSEKKKLAAEPSEEAKHRKLDSTSESQFSGVHETTGVKSKTQKQFNCREEDTISAKRLHEESISRYYRTDNLVTGHSESLRSHRQQSQGSGSGADITSSSQRKFSGSEEDATVDDCCKTCGRPSEEDASTRLKQDEHTRIEGSHYGYDSSINRQYKSGIDNRRESSVSTRISVEGLNQLQSQQSSHVAKSNKKYQAHSEVLEAGHRNAASSSSSQRQSEAQTKRFGGALTSSTYIQQVKSQEDDKVSIQSESKKASEDARAASVVPSGGVEEFVNPQKLSNQRTSYEETYLTSKKKFVEHRVEEHERIDETIVRSRLNSEVQRPIMLPGFQELTSEGTSTSGSSFGTKVQQVTTSGDEGNPQPVMMPLPSQLVERDPLYLELDNRFAKQASSGLKDETFDLHEYPPAVTVPSNDEDNGSGRSQVYESPTYLTPHGDALGSAERMQTSSMQIVDAFVEKASSVVNEERGQVHMESETTDSRRTHLKRSASRRSSGDSGARGPSVEMWDTRDSSLPEPSDMDKSDDTTTLSSEVSRRSGKSLWNVIGDVVRLRWSTRTETPKSPMKSADWASPNESAGSGTSSAGQDHDETNGNIVQPDKNDMRQEGTSGDYPLVGTHIQTGRVEMAGASRDERLLSVQIDAPSITRSSIVSSGISGSEDIDRNLDYRDPKATSVDLSLSATGELRRSHRRSQPVEETAADAIELSGNAATAQVDRRSHSTQSGASSSGNDNKSSQAINPVILSSPATARMRRSHGREEISDGGGGKVVGIGKSGTQEQINLGLAGGSDSDRKDAELKRRKLQRHDQVMKERFDEWEEVYMNERKQRKTDEMFMREALLEAKKAADTWEVPVGAVLVQDGKIIARGYNLVEELRDSTAHAEMICIRQASNFLRSWRLSETTLYVTLEPCAMCAGAILQARIGTLVWGAPNKLLGADGSWIRLFPNGGDGESSTQSSDKPAGPVHPFHPNMTIRRGILESECADAMQQFFQLRRKKEKNPEQQVARPSKVLNPSKLLHKMHHIFHLLFCL